MKRLKITIIAVLSVLAILAFRQYEQNRIIVNKSFSFGEKVEYRVHYGFINAAEARVEIARNLSIVNNHPCYKINVTGRTVGAFDLITRVRDNWRSYVDTLAIVPHMFYQSIQENKYRKEETIVFNHDKDQATSTIKEETKTFNTPNNINDIISGYFFLRTINFEKIALGEVIEIPTFFDGEVYKLRIKYAGKDVIKTKFGKIKVLKLNPLIPDNKLFKGEGAVKLWVSDDVNKIPLKAEVELAIGSLEMDIKSVKNLQTELEWF
ncbi:DUF3108 domain-containing protein [Dyadobacter frigoris]|uniref:DUF3108 domain-containing protein n=1 Tax=Dyadobacter frigoris TaxID=2576211 RepID=A0A4U6D1A7_9BACT|nr:DUF3108 domain-containing protein [Dyadobacter frigoris]TKT90892.1 DUF3108 domain-containing protein [Dyadobacter frigoris]GLU56744.1 hypothetical protein Dfri01_62050 [Dyadobacter frigoris]